jgi:hypothetical protein
LGLLAVHGQRHTAAQISQIWIINLLAGIEPMSAQRRLFTRWARTNASH